MRNFFAVCSLILGLFIFSANNCFAEQAISGPVLGSVSSLFGYRVDPFNGVIREHDGLDIAAPYGSPVYAMQDGRVIRSGSRGGYGLAITIEHYYPDIPQMPKLQTTYGHNAVLYVKVGEYVRRGQIISSVGSTGRSTGPHLHFEVTYKGHLVDPIDYLTKLPSYLAYINKVRIQAGYNRRAIGGP